VTLGLPYTDRRIVYSAAGAAAAAGATTATGTAATAASTAAAATAAAGTTAAATARATTATARATTAARTTAAASTTTATCATCNGACDGATSRTKSVISCLPVGINDAHNHKEEHDYKESVLGSILPGLLTPEPFQRG
jgi:hypothetical protein